MDRIRSRWRTASICGVVAALCGYALTSAYADTDHFNGRTLRPDWLVRSTGQAEYSVHDGWLHVNVPGQHWLAPARGGNMDGPMFLVAPPSVREVSFETRLRFVDGESLSHFVAAGLVIVRHTFQTLNKFQAERGWAPPVVSGEWWHVDSGGGGGGVEAFRDGEDLWMRFEHRGDTFVVFTKDAEDDPWTDVTEHMRAVFPLVSFRFEPGSYSIGLFVQSGEAPDEGVEVAFDYFHSPEWTLDVEPAGKTALAWAALRESTW